VVNSPARWPTRFSTSTSANAINATVRNEGSLSPILLQQLARWTDRLRRRVMVGQSVAPGEDGWRRVSSPCQGPIRARSTWLGRVDNHQRTWRENCKAMAGSRYLVSPCPNRGSALGADRSGRRPRVQVMFERHDQNVAAHNNNRASGAALGRFTTAAPFRGRAELPDHRRTVAGDTRRASGMASVIVRAETPTDIVGKAQREFNAALPSPKIKIKAQLAALGRPPIARVSRTRLDVPFALRTRQQKWEKVITLSGNQGA